MNVVSLPSVIIMYILVLNRVDIEMGTVCFAILNTNNPNQYFTNITNGKILVAVHDFSEEAKK